MNRREVSRVCGASVFVTQVLGFLAVSGARCLFMGGKKDLGEKDSLTNKPGYSDLESGRSFLENKQKESAPLRKITTISVANYKTETFK